MSTYPTSTAGHVPRRSPARGLPALSLRNDAAQSKLQRARRLATLMDSAFRIPGTSRTVGFDSLLGLIPGLGDVAATAVSGFIVRDAFMLGARRRVIAKMVLNIVVDLAVGAIPLVGDLFDFAFKSNIRNVALLEKDLARRQQV